MWKRKENLATLDVVRSEEHLKLRETYEQKETSSCAGQALDPESQYQERKKTLLRFHHSSWGPAVSMSLVVFHHDDVSDGPDAPSRLQILAFPSHPQLTCQILDSCAVKFPGRGPNGRAYVLATSLV